LAYPLKLRNYSETLINQKINRALDYLGIEGLTERKVKTLTKEEKLIVNVARSILRDADIYLIDDIFSFDKATNEKLAKVFCDNYNKEASIIYNLDKSNEYLAKLLKVDNVINISHGAIEK